MYAGFLRALNERRKDWEGWDLGAKVMLETWEGGGGGVLPEARAPGTWRRILKEAKKDPWQEPVPMSEQRNRP